MSYDIERLAAKGTFQMLASVKVTGSYSNYQWVDADLLPVPVAYYRLKIWEKDGLFSHSKTIAIEQSGATKLKTYPNPVANVLTVAGVDTEMPFELVNALGQVVVSGRLNLPNTEIDMATLPKGLYTLKTSKTQHTIIKQ